MDYGSYDAEKKSLYNMGTGESTASLSENHARHDGTHVLNKNVIKSQRFDRCVLSHTIQSHKLASILCFGDTY